MEHKSPPYHGRGSFYRKVTIPVPIINGQYLAEGSPSSRWSEWPPPPGYNRFYVIYQQEGFYTLEHIDTTLDESTISGIPFMDVDDFFNYTFALSDGLSPELTYDSASNHFVYQKFPTQVSGSCIKENFALECTEDVLLECADELHVAPLNMYSAHLVEEEELTPIIHIQPESVVETAGQTCPPAHIKRRPSHRSAKRRKRRKYIRAAIVRKPPDAGINVLPPLVVLGRLAEKPPDDHPRQCNMERVTHSDYGRPPN